MCVVTPPPPTPPHQVVFKHKEILSICLKKGAHYELIQSAHNDLNYVLLYTSIHTTELVLVIQSILFRLLSEYLAFKTT